MQASQSQVSISDAVWITVAFTATADAPVTAIVLTKDGADFARVDVAEADAGKPGEVTFGGTDGMQFGRGVYSLSAYAVNDAGQSAPMAPEVLVVAGLLPAAPTGMTIRFRTAGGAEVTG